jgi:hypothetical protein
MEASQKVSELKARCCGTEETESIGFASISIKMKKGYEDKAGFFKALQDSSMWEMPQLKNKMPCRPNFKFNDGHLTITCHAKPPAEAMAGVD